MVAEIKGSRQEFEDKLERKAFGNERDYHGCCQSVLAALQDAFGVRDDAVFQAASGMAGGMGLTSESCCGGFAAGCLFIGQLCGRSRDPDGSFADKENRRFKGYKYCQLLAERFFEEYDSCNCHEIQKLKMDKGYVLSDSNQFDEFIAKGGHSHVCPEVAGKAARWASEVVLDNIDDFGLAEKIQLK